MRRSRRVSAFSLVEIALAVGIVAFALTAIMGLLASGMGSGKASTDDTIVATMTKAIVSDLRQRSFPTLPGTVSVGAGVSPLAVTAPIPIHSPTAALPSAAAAIPIYYFDSAGNRVMNPDGTDPTTPAQIFADGAIYQCTETLQGDSTTLGTSSTPSTTNPSSTQAVNLLNIQLKFQWPAPANNASSQKIIYASVANY